MTANEIAKIYGVGRNDIDYWTRIGLLHPLVNTENGYRDYDKCMSELELITIAEVLDWPGSLKKRVERLSEFDEYEWKTILEKLSRNRENYDKRYSIAYSSASKRSDE